MKSKKTGIVTPIFNQSLNRAPNELDTISIDSFDTLPDPIPTSDHQIQPAPNFLSSDPQSPSSLLPPQLHPSFFLLNGFTAEFKINKSDQKETCDKQIQVDIRYLPMTGSAENFSEKADWSGQFTEKLTGSQTANEELKPNALRYVGAAIDRPQAARPSNELAGSVKTELKRCSNRFPSDLNQPKFYVLDDLFGETNFKRKRSLIREKPEPRSELFRPGKADSFSHFELQTYCCNLYFNWNISGSPSLCSMLCLCFRVSF